MEQSRYAWLWGLLLLVVVVAVKVYWPDALPHGHRPERPGPRAPKPEPRYPCKPLPLPDALNGRLAPELAYRNGIFDRAGSGRHIATALLTRLPVVRDRTTTLGNRQRILRTQVRVNRHDLVVVVSHWTSRLTDKTG